MYKARTPYLYLLFPLVLLVLFFFLPFFMAFQISLFDYGHDLYQPELVGMDNYARLWHSPAFWNALINTAVFVLGVVPAMVAIPIFMAVLLNAELKGIALFRSLIYLPVVISMVVVGIAWRWLYNADYGLINYFLEQIGLPRIGWLVNPDIALYALMIVIVWKGVAYYMMMYLAHLQSLSRDLYEAAEIDGATPWQKHWHVTLPHLQPTMVMVAVISTIGSLKVFAEIYVMTRGGPVGSTKTLVYYIYERAFENLDLGIASAAGIVLMVILMGLSWVQLRYSDFGRDEKVKPARLEGKS
jgi:putative chitobiose transport system permease protein